MKLSRVLGWVLLALLFGVVGSAAQQTPAAAKPATVVFRLDWKQAIPWMDYAFTVQEDGSTHFAGTGNPAESGDGDSFQQDFAMSPANTQNIFQWAKATDYFQGQFETKTKNVAKTGIKTLEYHGPSLDTSTSYNFSPNPNIQQLTKLFQSISVTLDYGRKLAYQYRFDKLGMDTRLKELVDLQSNGQAEELQAIEPILRKIAEDDNMMHMARLQARQLLKAASPDAAASKPLANQR
jgi:hypothetical protein